MNTVVIAPAQIVNLIKGLANIKGVKFVAVKGYENANGEISNYVINCGASYGNAKQADLEALENPEILKGIDFGSVAMYAEQARIALIEAIKKPSKGSEAQTEAYLTVAPNVRLHLESGRLFVFGFTIPNSKVILKEGVYPSVNSAPLTIAKDKIRKVLKATKFRQFAFDKLTTVRVNGETLEIDL
jgi:hypothetical protein